MNKKVAKLTVAYRHDRAKDLKVAKHLSNEQKDDLIIDNREKGRKLACSILRKWGARIELSELESIVDLSLCEAVKHFDPDHGTAFTTFMFYYLRGNLIRTINKRASNCPIPLEFSDENIESGFIGKERINNTEVEQIYGIRDSHQPEEKCIHNGMVKLAEKACQTLSPLEQEIIKSIYLQEEQVTKLARELNYSRCHISRMKTTAVRKMRKEYIRLSGEKL